MHTAVLLVKGYLIGGHHGTACSYTMLGYCIHKVYIQA